MTNSILSKSILSKSQELQAVRDLAEIRLVTGYEAMKLNCQRWLDGHISYDVYDSIENRLNGFVQKQQYLIRHITHIQGGSAK